VTFPPAGVPGRPATPPPGYDWRLASPPAPRRSKIRDAGIVTAILLAAAALVVGVVDLTRSTPAPAPVVSAPASAAPTTAATPGDTSAADRALCTTIGPLMAESDRQVNTLIKLGDAGTPARDAAIPKYITDTQDWVGRMQPILDQHPDVNPFLHRTLRRFVDDQRLATSDLDPGPLPQYIKSLFSDSVGAYAGPLHVCFDLGVKW
jgi:hypothetical protein